LVTGVFGFSGAAPAAVALTQLSSDPFTNGSSQHRTQVEPDSFAFGSTIVAAFQSGRFFDGGASGIGFATSTNGGASWSSGFLSGLTRYLGAGPYDRASDPSVAYDARHNVWLIQSLGLSETPSVGGRAVVVNRSANGGASFGGPVTVATGSLDKNWIVCDNFPASQFYGRCYSEWDDVADSGRVRMSTSADGGLTWGPARNSGDSITGIGGQPVVQPNGQVIVPLMNSGGTAILSFRSVDGGASWRATAQVASITDHAVAGGLRSPSLPSAEVDAAGKVYVAWQDCRFRSGCASNDIVYATTTQGGYPTWSGVSRIPIDPTTSAVDHFIPGLAVDPSTSGAGGRLALAYYYYPQANCTAATCQLDVGLVTSSNGGASWSAPSQLAGPMTLSSLANTNQGRMVGDYISTSYAGGAPHPVFAVAKAPSGATFDEAIYTTAGAPPPPPPPPPPPTVTLTSTPPSSTNSTSAHFEWTTTGTVTSTTCKLDTALPVACASPKDYAGLAAGNHTFTVTVSNTGGSNSTGFSWTITSQPPPGGLIRLSNDPFTNTSSQHRTQVEPDSFAFGSTIVAAFQSGRFLDGGASGIGFATSTNGGASWSSGFLSGLTKYLGPGPYDRASDPSVAYDARHGVWLIESLALMETPSVAGKAVVVSRSTNGGLSFANPVTIATGGFLDKNWIVCDNWPQSTFYGRCYAEWDDVNDSGRVKMSVSTDGGVTWGPARNSGDSITGVGGQPVVQPNGQVIVPLMSSGGTAILSFRSVDGGASWRATVTVASITDHAVAGGLRTSPLPSAEVDGAGNVYVAWQDCRFRSGCAANDIVMASTSISLYPNWNAVARIPIDPTTSTVDHFIPGLAVDPTSSGSGGRLTLAYYYYPQANCTAATCQLDVGLVSSSNGGASWSAPSQLAGPVALSWLANTNQGRMVGDYISTSYAGGTAHPVFALANAPSGGNFDEAIYSR
jgi:hypothetical protein